MKKKTPFLDYFNQCVELGRLPKPTPSNLYNGRVTLMRVSPETTEEIELVKAIWKKDKDKFTLIRQFAILLCAANNNEL